MGADASALTPAEIERYGRHLLLPEVGGQGQARLRSARVLIVGAGGLGSPLALYLAAAGVGTVGIADHDTVELSNLQRQIAHGVRSVGSNKAVSAARAVEAINPLVACTAHPERITEHNADRVIAGYDIIADGTDNFPARYAIADSCVRLGKTLVSASVSRFEGQLATFRPGLPCYRCLYPEPPPAAFAPRCADAGILGPVTGVLGTLQATEVLKEILGIGETLAGRLLIWDALLASFHLVRFARNPLCAGCGAPQRSP